MRVLITGGGGQLGRELRATAPPAAEVEALPRERLDLGRRASIAEAVAGLTPDLIVNAAAYTAVDRAEDEPERAFAINGRGAGWLAEAAAARGCRLIHISTDFVFAGDRPLPYTPADEPAPLSVYGRSKREGEKLVLSAAGDRALVVRTAWLYSRFGRNFVKTMLGLMAERKSLSVVGDQVSTPTWARSLAEALWRAAERPELSGILHWTEAGVASRYDFAVALQEEGLAHGLLGRRIPIRLVRSGDSPGGAPRPAYSALDCRSAWDALGGQPRHWRAALKTMLAELRELGDG